MANLKSLSEHLGLSQATVSRALNGYSTVKPATRQRVEEAAKRLNYRPNSSAQRLATGKAGAFGVILTAGDGMLIDPHFSEFLAGLTRKLSETDTDVVIATATPENQAATYKRFANSGKVDGFIVSAPQKSDSRIETLLDMNFPFVVHGQCETSKRYSYYDIDNFGALQQATDLLLQLGHRRIALLNGPSDAMFTSQRLAGFTAALSSYGVSATTDLVHESFMTEKFGYQSVIGMLASQTPPTAIICSSVLLALGAHRAIRETGLEIGKDISIISHDDDLSSMRTENFSVPLTVTRAPIRDAAVELAGMLRGIVDGTTTNPLQREVPIELIVRDSTAPAPAS